MAKNDLRILSPMAFVKMVVDRTKTINAAADEAVPAIASYTPNRLADALHPNVQFLTVSRIIPFSDDVKTYVLTPCADMGTTALAYFSAGSYLAIEVVIDGKIYTRPYSLSSSPQEALAGEYRLTIKRVPDGIVSGYILDNWTVGTSFAASAPLGEFTYEPLRDAKTIVGVAGGSGITPFRSLAKAIADGDEDANLVLLYGTPTLAEALFEDEFAEIAKNCDRFQLVHVLSDEKLKGCESGFITAKLIKKYAPKKEDYSVFMCGPQAMYRFLDGELPKLGLRRKFIRRELFGEYFHPEKEADYTGDVNAVYHMTVRMNGKTFEADCPANTSLLRSMEDAGIHAPSDCRSGQCGWCHSLLVSGQVYIPATVDGRREADADFGYIHPCITFPLSDVVLEVPAAHG